MFQFPSNGKAYPKSIRYGTFGGINVFQFPSNGKAYPKYCNIYINFRRGRCVSIPFKREGISKVNINLCFPQSWSGVSIPFKREGISKVRKSSVRLKSIQVSIPFKREGISKGSTAVWIENSTKIVKVSIPFKREGISKVRVPYSHDRTISFNSLQTGRHIQRHDETQQRMLEGQDRFQFPSNGKAYPKKELMTPRHSCRPCVSIPFKREGISKALKVLQVPRQSAGFNSLQTGRHIQSQRNHILQGDSWDDVSIPFKREGISKEHGSQPCAGDGCDVFQFPSNGKAYPKCITEDINNSEQILVSIPFKREGISKDPFTKRLVETLWSFNSLQTGRHIQRSYPSLYRLRLCCQFQFPSNGKAYPKTIRKGNNDGIRFTVSIPFKRESLSKVKLAEPAMSVTFLVVSIPFKRESLSKGMDIKLGWPGGGRKFQFPSNGKAYPKEGCREYGKNHNMSFNSLQTGKPIQRCVSINFWLSHYHVSIPFKRESLSKEDVQLQTIEDAGKKVSIPFKRESLSKDIRNRISTALAIVSIPFKRESLSKVDRPGIHHDLYQMRFNSLQTGKPIQSFLPNFNH